MPIDFRRDPDFFSSYANNVHLEISTWDIKFIFGQTDTSINKDAVIEHTAITIPWNYAKIFSYQLRATIAAREAETGHIEVPDRILQAPPEELPKVEGAKNPEEVLAAIKKVWEEFVTENPELKK